MILLNADDPPPVILERRLGRSIFVLTVDHAGARIPSRLGDLGVSRDELERHIAWDIGCLGLARRLAADLDAPLVAQRYSRLVIDCNRVPGVSTSIPTTADGVVIPGNLDLREAEIAARTAEIFAPYHACLDRILDERVGARRPTILIALHTMTDVFQGVQRKMHAAVLHHRDRRFAALMLELLRQETDVIAADNDPYVVEDTHYTIPHHAERRAIPCVALEIRQDLVTAEVGQAEWARRLGAALRAAEQSWTHATRGECV